MAKTVDLGKIKLKKEVEEDIRRRMDKKLPDFYFVDTKLVDREDVINHLVEYFLEGDNLKMDNFLNDLEVDLIKFDRRKGVEERDSSGNLKSIIVTQIEEIIKERSRENSESQELRGQESLVSGEGDNRPDAKMFFFPSKK